jgi:FkbM family methyltransferase
VNGLKQQFVRLLYPYGSIRRVLRGPLRGTRFVVEPSMGLTYSLGSDAFNFRFLSKKIQPGNTIFDIGGNKGQMALFFSVMVGAQGKVVSFEPVPEQFEILIRNIQLNGFHNVHGVPLAAADSTGKASFAYTSGRSTEGKLSHVEPENYIEDAKQIIVNTTRLDEWYKLNDYRPDLLKIDVEGGAASVLGGATDLLDELHPTIYIELHGVEERQGVRDLLLPRGYTVETLAGEKVRDPLESIGPLWCYHPLMAS